MKALRLNQISFKDLNNLNIDRAIEQWKNNNLSSKSIRRLM